MKKFKAIKVIVLVLMLVLLCSGCLQGEKGNSETGSQAANYSAAAVPNQAGNGDDLEIPDMGKNDKGKEEDGAPEEDEALYTWCIVIDDKIAYEEEGVEIEHNLKFVTKKMEGYDQFGIYDGSAEIYSSMDFGKILGNNTAFGLISKAEGGGKNDNHSFEVVPYNRADYSVYGEPKDAASLVPLVDAEAMVLGTLTAEGSGSLYIDLHSKLGDGVQAQVDEKVQGTESIPYKMYIKGEKVQVFMPSLNIKGGKTAFEGKLIKVLNTDEEPILADLVPKKAD